MRLIDKDKLMEILCQHCDSHIEMCEDCPMRELIESVPEETLPDAPEVNAVPVVRCMECKYMRESVDGLFKSGYFCERCHITSDMENCDDFYCADGERRTDEQ